MDDQNYTLARGFIHCYIHASTMKITIFGEFSPTLGAHSSPMANLGKPQKGSTLPLTHQIW